MKKLGVKQSESDPCLFIRGIGPMMLILCIYVDDGYIIGKTSEIKRFFAEVRNSGMNMTTEQSMGDYLSCEVRFDKSGNKAWLGQPHMIKKIEKTFGKQVASLKGYRTPGTPGFSVIRPKEGDTKVSEEEQAVFRSGTGMLLYLVKHSRPDIANPVRELTKCMDGATPAAFKEMLRVIKHVLDTKTLGLRIEPKMLHKVLWHMVLWSDSDWAGDKDNRKSVSGLILFVLGVPVMWRSKQQKTVALSSTEAEFIAASEAIKEVVFVIQVLVSIGIAVETPVVVRVDNMGAVFMSENQSSASRTRHIDTRWHYTRDLVNEKVIKIVFVRTAENKSDVLTKNVPGEIHDRHSDNFVWKKDAVWEDDGWRDAPNQ